MRYDHKIYIVLPVKYSLSTSDVNGNFII